MKCEYELCQDAAIKCLRCCYMSHHIIKNKCEIKSCNNYRPIDLYFCPRHESIMQETKMSDFNKIGLIFYIIYKNMSMLQSRTH